MQQANITPLLGHQVVIDMKMENMTFQSYWKDKGKDSPMWSTSFLGINPYTNPDNASLGKCTIMEQKFCIIALDEKK